MWPGNTTFSLYIKTFYVQLCRYLYLHSTSNSNNITDNDNDTIIPPINWFYGHLYSAPFDNSIKYPFRCTLKNLK